MGDVSGVGARRHFSVEEEDSLRKDEATSTIVKKDTKANVEVYGTDRSWRATKEHQQSPLHNKAGSLEVAHAGVEAAELAGVAHLGAAGAIGGPLSALGLGLYSLGEAHVKGEEQARALTKDNAHVALIAVLDLPAGYKAARLDGEYKHVTKGNGSTAEKFTTALRADVKGCATLQLHADRGMNAARDLSASKMPVEAFLKANPKIAESYKNDAAFREGFDAYLHAKAHLPPADVTEMEQKLNERDGWYAQSQISFRV